jgi:ABC-type polysaccharide/polyol phosphate transport system ATPase subunit/ABC-type polysaccharide/polyol phosphate export permease
MSGYRPAVPVEESAARATLRPNTPPGPAIRVQGVSKVFDVPRHRHWTLKERMRHPVLSRRHDRLQALDGVSFDVAPGEFFAIIGRNGSGKSTLLRCIAGIHEPDSGEVEVHAPIAPFIELGVGFHPQLAAADNVTVAGTLMGLRPKEAQRRFPDVIRFAELEEFVEMPLANYSSGMQVRLAFSTSFQVDAEVLLFDEVLAVGDEVFRRKCTDTFERLIERGHTIVYVTHGLETVRQFADRVLLLERGRPVSLGEPDEVIEEYQRRNREHELAEARRPAPATRTPAARHGDDLILPPLAGNGRPSRWRRFADITLSLARAEFKLRYLDSAVGYVWALAQPLLWFAVLYLVWTEIFDVQSQIENFKLGLLVAIALFSFFTEATGHALGSLVGKGTMLRKIPFPAIALPMSSVLTSCIVYACALVIVFGFILASGVTPTLLWLEMIPLLAFLLAFTLGMSLVLSVLYVGIRDVEQVWVVTCRLLFFLTPVFYSISLVPGALQKVMMLNPLAVVCVQARYALVAPNSQSAVDAAGVLPVAGSVFVVAAVLGGGLWLYRQQSGRVAERI